MVGYRDLKVDFLKPDLDDRDYRAIELTNGLKALVISDATADKAAAALDVNIGAFQDPEELSGLAHFCEHLLFMGSEKFPDENEYSSFLSKHGGYSNAYTGATNTNYFFEVNHEHLKGALERFSGFFTCPLFNKDSTDKEINAVDSENKKNLQNDNWRFYQLEKSLTNFKHPYHKFSTGNLKTLKDEPLELGLNIRDELLKFYKKYYSANLMKLCIIGREDLDTLSDWASSLFTDVKNHDVPIPTYDATILEEDNLKKIIRIRPVKNLKKLTITFATPDMDLTWESKPNHFISHLIGHEGSGSLLACLKSLGWANDLSAGGHTVTEDNAFFTIDIDLTDKGLKNFEEIAHLVFQYIQMLKTSLPEEWIYLELEDISKANFKFKQKANPANTVSGIAKAMEKFYIPLENILSTSLYRKYEPELIINYINSLTPKNSRINLVGKHMEVDEKEKWYGTEYSVKDYSKDFLEHLEHPGLNPNLHLPRPNEFIANKFNVDKLEDVVPLDEPHLLKKDEISKLWYKKDDTFWQPRGYIYVSMKLPQTNCNVSNSMLTSLYVHLLNDYLKDLQYDAACAHLNLSFSKTNQGLDLTISGFNDKLLTLLTRFIEGIKTFQPEKERFHVFKDKIIQNLTNILYEVPYSQMNGLYSLIINHRTWSNQEKISVTNKINFDMLKSFLPQLYNELHFECLVHGNFEYEQAVEVDAIVRKLTVNDIANTHVNEYRLRSLMLPEKKAYNYQVELLDKENINSCIQHIIQVGLYTENLAAIASLFAQILHEPCFDTLRTKEQLGYVVFSSTIESHSMINIRILVQSEHSTPYLEWRIDEFYKSFGEKLNNMKDEEFDKHKEALVKSLLQKNKNMKEENSKYSTSIYIGDYNFTHRQKKAKMVEKLTKEQLLSFYEENVCEKNSTKLVVHLQSSVESKTKSLKEGDLDTAKYPTGKNIDNVDLFKSQLCIAPPRPQLKEFDIYLPNA